MISESVENKANEVLLSMLNGVEQASEFVVEQAPDVVQQLLTWHFVISFIWFVFGVVLVVAALPVFKKLNKWGKQKKKELETAYKNKEAWTRFLGDRNSSTTSSDFDFVMGNATFGQWVVLGLMLLFGFIFLISNLDWLQIWLAPKLYLLEYAAELAK